MKLKSKIIYLLAILVTIFSCSFIYGKRIDLNGLKINLKESVDKETVNIELMVKNDNPYETANITIEELAPSGFRQLDSKKNEKIINLQLEPNSERKIEYSYKYHQSFLKDQNNSILYDEDGNIIDSVNDVKYEDGNSKAIKEENKNKGNINEETEDLKRGALGIVKFIIVFVVCVVLFLTFIMFYKTIKGNNDDFYDNNLPKCLILFVLISIVISICNGRTILANNKYSPQIYEYGRIYEKVIYEPVSFNDGMYRFAYKISLNFDTTYVINDEDYEKDTDGDGLIDAFEYMYMTDKNNVDTDDDGLSDYIEVMFLDYNSLSEDTFDDDIKDGDRDFDNDKLTNIEEVNYGTELYNVDTDYDTITDYDEINVHNTNPLNIDTDEDLLSDPDELKLGLDPTNPRNDGVTLDSERKIEQEYNMTNVPENLRKGDIFLKEISGSVSGVIDNCIGIKTYMNANLENAKGVVGMLFKVENTNNFDLNIVLDANKVSDRAKYLIVCRYEDNTLIPIQTRCNENDELKCIINNGVYCVADSDLILRELNIFNQKYEN